MLIRMTTPMEGNGVSRRRGQEVEVSDKEGASLITAGFAVPVREERNVETTAKTRRGSGRKKK